MTRAVQIELWSVTTLPRSPYDPPELGESRLQGVALNHPKHPGERWPMVSSPMVNATPEGFIQTRSGRVYLLGEVDPAYELIYPDAKERLLASLRREK